MRGALSRTQLVNVHMREETSAEVHNSRHRRRARAAIAVALRPQSISVLRERTTGPKRRVRKGWGIGGA